MSDNNRPNPFAQRLNIQHILTTSPPPQDHVLPGLLAGTVGMLAGPGGVGKTMFELQLAMAVACGGEICGGLFEKWEVSASEPRKPGRVVMVVAEESHDVIWHRLHAVVATLFERPELLGIEADPEKLIKLWSENLHIYPLDGMPRVTLIDRDLEVTDNFKQLMTACDGARLVIVDPIRRFHSCDENDSGAMTALVQSLQQASAWTKAAIIFAQHVNRASMQTGIGDTAGAARGSTALTDGVRWQLNLSEPTKEVARSRGIDVDDRKRFVMVDIAKANYLPPQRTEMLERLPGGVLLLTGKSFNPAPIAKSSNGRFKPKLKVVAP